MDIIYALVPLSILLIGIAVLVFFWAVKNGQFDDMDSPAHRILFDDDDLPTYQNPEQQNPEQQNSEPREKRTQEGKTTSPEQQSDTKPD
ncbi:MAG: cbb3-type cytochrome oxidase assembly protein CcoS [Oceanospirillaceae bacterium]|uniref:cbb3-type cytochrome oxidase assembly protein CcoS n=1 Tax=Marinobacter nauticus TaxID=2743 RepID=UPI000C644C34|nr:cbb3-type cytochrome oxidase assembly protein CcoS [Oceanospirillaceae bacterium]MBT12372.1 cbb3-type cytochrome oxidase assembly protein CcoS [Oceanospirillaceae bacterium]|tara:strand:- start:64065 stop:64331 length:267 start_codon:yes stop_codon:yes gene_type:complete